MKLSCNTILFGDVDLETCLKHIAWAGFEGVELSAAHVRGCLEQQVPASALKGLARNYGLEICSFELKAEAGVLEYARDLGLNRIASSPPGRQEDLATFIEQARRFAAEAERAGVRIAVKPHVGHPVHHTASMLRFLQQVSSPWFGINFDPSHIFRAGEKPEESVLAVGSHILHCHFRDCPDPQDRGPGAPGLQVPGRGRINMMATLKALHHVGYEGPLSLQIVGSPQFREENPLSRLAAIAAEGQGYLRRCLEELG